MKQLDKLEAQDSLLNFSRLMWAAVEPARKFVDGWPLEAICEHLEAVSNNQISKLLINVPPGFMKSLMTDVFWPAWEWGPRNMPSMRYLAFSYTQSLTVRDNIRFRNVIMHDLYRALWGERFGPSTDQFTSIKVANNKTGWKIATSVGGVGTGERGDRLIIDDPNSVKEAESEQVRSSTNMWFREVLPDRFNDLTVGKTVVIQQRTHDEDVSGVILSEDLGYEVLCIPMEFDQQRSSATVIGWTDPRAEDGELAWPARFPESVLEDLRVAKGEYAYAGQYQQSPVPRGGGIIKRDWWKLYPPEGEEFTDDGTPIKALSFPPMEYIVASVDTAYTVKEENDWSAMTVLGIWRDAGGIARVMLMDAWQARIEFHDLTEKIIKTCMDRRVDRLLIEAKANGLSVAQEIARVCYGNEFGVQVDNPKGDKTARLYSVQHMWENGFVFAPDRKYAERVIDQVSIFPRGKHDDLVDAMTSGMKHLRDSGILMTSVEHQIDYTDRNTFKGNKKQKSPYDV